MTTTVVMATYNGAQFIAEQLDSLAAQTTPPQELVVSDDGSTDDTVQLVEQFRDRAGFPVVLLQNRTRLGYGENFLQACRHARGSAIAFCDQDDVWLPDKLEVATRHLQEDRADLFVHTATATDAQGRDLGWFSQGIRRDGVAPPLTLPPWGVFYGCSMVFRTALLHRLDMDRRGRHTFEHQGALSHDLWVYFLAQSLGRTSTSTRPLVRYRRHGNNQTPPVLGRTLRSWTTSLGQAADVRLPRQEIAATRSRLLREAAATARSAADRRTAQAAAEWWQAVADHEDRRLRTYAATTPWARARELAGSVGAGTYRPAQASGLGRRLLVKDTLAGVARMRRRTPG